ncbi:NUDIX domain-containing protein [Patescibacteria group bacterium]|nr:NUDIX domain-containing protein [Patescibacteria group bacterium]
MLEDQLFYVGQKAIINKNGKILILNDPILGLDLPGGKIQKDEFNLKASLKREIKEETNLDVDVGSACATWLYEVPADSGHRSAGRLVYTVAYKCKYLSGDLKLSDEHDGYIWVDKNSYTKLEHSWPAYSVIESYFTSL